MIRILDRAHAEMRELLATGAPVYVTINPVEYHGPHLSLHNDKLLSVGACRALHERLSADHPDWPELWADDLEIGVEPASGPGSRHLLYPAARRLVREACRALTEIGVKRVVLMTFHGAPLHSLAIEAGVRLLRDAGVAVVAPFNRLMQKMVDLDAETYAAAFDHIDDPAERAAMLADMAIDFHAGFFETSLALHFAPESVSPIHRELPDCAPYPTSPVFAAASGVARRLGLSAAATELQFISRAFHWSRMDPFPGYTGRPRHATAEAGAYFAALMMDEFEAATRAVFESAQPSPRPVMRWMPAVTLGGRLVPAPVPLSRMQDGGIKR